MKTIGLGAAFDPSVVKVHLHDGHASGYVTHPSWLVGNRDGRDRVASWSWAGGPPK